MDGWLSMMTEMFQEMQNDREHGGPFGFYAEVIPQCEDFTKPHVVWTEGGDSQTQALEGSMVVRVNITLDFRARGYVEVRQLRDRVLRGLRQWRILRRVEGTASFYDQETDMRRLTVDVGLNPLPLGRPVEHPRIRIFGPQFGPQFA